MIALTSRLNERDETIIQLQEELESFDRIHVETEEYLEKERQRSQQLEKLLAKNQIQIPKRSLQPGSPTKVTPLISI